MAGITEKDNTAARQIEEELLAEQRFLQHLLQVQEGERASSPTTSTTASCKR